MTKVGIGVLLKWPNPNCPLLFFPKDCLMIHLNKF